MSRWHKTEFDRLPEHAFSVRPGGGMTLEGGKGGSSAPAPDPKLVAAQVKNLGIQDDMMEQMIANTEAMAPLQKEQTQFALDTSKTAWEQSQDDRDYAVNRRNALTGVQDILIEQARGFNTAAHTELLAGQAAGDVQQSFAQATEANNRSMARMGLNPADAKFAAINSQNAIAQAASLAGAKNNARTQARSEGYALTDRATNALAGYPAMGMQTTAATQGYGAAGMNIANSGLAGLNSGYQQVSSAAANSTNAASNAYNSQASAYNQGQQAAAAHDANTGTLVGIGVSAAIAI